MTGIATRTVQLNPRYFRGGVVPEGAELQNILEQKGRGSGVWLQISKKLFALMRPEDRALSFRQRRVAIPQDQFPTRVIERQGTILALLAEDCEGDVMEFKKDGIWYYALVLPGKITEQQMQPWVRLGWGVVPDEYIGRTITLELKELLTTMAVSAIVVTSSPASGSNPGQLEVATNALRPMAIDFGEGLARVLIATQETNK
jgi:hypothetical protein